MVNFGTDLVVMGGYSNGSYSSAFYQLSAENGKLKWEKMKPELKNPRDGFVVVMCEPRTGPQRFVRSLPF